MIFPFPEIKFSAIVRTAAYTAVTVRLYRCDDGGLGSQGQQLIVRTVKRERRFEHLDAGITKQQLIDHATARFTEWATDLGLDAIAARLVCTL